MKPILKVSFVVLAGFVIFACTTVSQVATPSRPNSNMFGMRASAPNLWREPGQGRGAPGVVSGAWYFAVPLERLNASAFSDALKQYSAGPSDPNASSLVTNAIEVSSSLLDYHTNPSDIPGIQQSLGRTRIVSYRVPSIRADEGETRKLFAFAKALNMSAIVVEKVPEALPMIDGLAHEYGVKVALATPVQP